MSIIAIVLPVMFQLPGFTADNRNSTDREKDYNNGSYFESCGKNSEKGCNRGNREKGKWGKKRIESEDKKKENQK